MNIPRLMPRKSGPTGNALRRLFDRDLSPALCGSVGAPDYQTVGDETVIWLPHCRTIVLAMANEPSQSKFDLTRYAEMARVDVLTLDLTRPGSIVAVEADLFSPARLAHGTVFRLALSMSVQRVPALVPDLPRRAPDQTHPASMRLTPRGLVVVPDPFRDDEDWAVGVTRGMVAALEALTARPATRVGRTA